MSKNEVVISGLGVVSPLGDEQDSFWTALCEKKSGVGLLKSIQTESQFQVMGSEVGDFHPKDYVKPKKNIKVMSREIQMGFVAAMKAVAESGVRSEENVAPERFGVIYGSDLIGIEIPEVLDAFLDGISDDKHDFSTWGKSAMSRIFPLWMLKYLPNMPASHIGIALDARGPSNTPTMCRGSGLASVFEAARIIERGAADVMLCGSCGSHTNPVFVARSHSIQLAELSSDPSSLPRPFDADRCGTVIGEGAAAFVLERKDFALARGANILATIKGFANCIDPFVHKKSPHGKAIAQSLQLALERSGVSPSDVSHINCEGLGTTIEDRIEAQAIKDVLGDVPVTSQKGNFGELGSGSGAVELAALLISMKHSLVPPVRNHDKTADDCPINVVMNKPLPVSSPFAMKLSFSKVGNAFALVLGT